MLHPLAPCLSQACAPDTFPVHTSATYPIVDHLQRHASQVGCLMWADHPLSQQAQSHAARITVNWLHLIVIKIHFRCDATHPKRNHAQTPMKWPSNASALRAARKHRKPLARPASRPQAYPSTAKRDQRERGPQASKARAQCHPHSSAQQRPSSDPTRWLNHGRIDLIIALHALTCCSAAWLMAHPLITTQRV